MSSNELKIILTRNIFLNKYDLDFICVGTIDITSIFRDYEITDNIGVFYAFDNYFCITIIQAFSIVCKYIDKENRKCSYVKLNLEYIPNSK